MSDQPGAAPDPQANRDAWLAGHPQAQPVTPEVAQEQTSPGTQAGPDSGVLSGEAMVAQGARPGVAPRDGSQSYEDMIDALMHKLEEQSETIQGLVLREKARAAEHVAAFGEPVLQSCSKAVRDGLLALKAAHPGHDGWFDLPLTYAEDLVTVTDRAISGGANDMSQVVPVLNDLDRWFTRQHHRKAPPFLRHAETGTAEDCLDRVIEEAHRLTGTVPGGSGALALTH